VIKSEVHIICNICRNEYSFPMDCIYGVIIDHGLVVGLSKGKNTLSQQVHICSVCLHRLGENSKELR
jgi:hypothetical protein